MQAHLALVSTSAKECCLARGSGINNVFHSKKDPAEATFTPMPLTERPRQHTVGEAEVERLHRTTSTKEALGG
jgi:hypothetical protein